MIIHVETPSRLAVLFSRKVSNVGYVTKIERVIQFLI
jgi:hypothetical protein